MSRYKILKNTKKKSYETIINNWCTWRKIHPIQLPYTTPNSRYNYSIFGGVVAHCIGALVSAVADTNAPI